MDSRVDSLYWLISNVLRLFAWHEQFRLLLLWHSWSQVEQHIRVTHAPRLLWNLLVLYKLIVTVVFGNASEKPQADRDVLFRSVCSVCRYPSIHEFIEASAPVLPRMAQDVETRSKVLLPVLPRPWHLRRRSSLRGGFGVATAIPARLQGHAPMTVEAFARRLWLSDRKPNKVS
jgi:hypothetical protein